MGFVFIRDSWQDRKIADYMKQLEKQYNFEHEDPQDISHIPLPIYIIIKLQPKKLNK